MREREKETDRGGEEDRNCAHVYLMHMHMHGQTDGGVDSRRVSAASIIHDAVGFGRGYAILYNIHFNIGFAEFFLVFF